MKNWRFVFILIAVFLFGAAIISRLIYIQIVKYDYYRALAQGQQKIFNLVKGSRGKISFSGGQILAIDLKKKQVFISPLEIEEKEKTAEKLAEVLDLDKDLMLEKVGKNNLFEKIKVDLTEKKENDLKKLELKGVYISEDVFREYPQRSLASQVVGFYGGEEKGQYGLEGYYDDLLQGKEEFQEKKGGLGNYFSLTKEKSAKGKDIVLTLDYNIQFKAESLLKKAKENFNVESAQIVVIDPNSGRILALANYPDFDPNNYSEVKDFKIFQNSVTQKLFEPGSVFKPITMAGALDREKITPQTSYVDKGRVKIGGWVIYNYDERSYGKRTMTEVLEKSINTGAIFAERRLGNNLFLDYLNKFGFFEPTGIDLQKEIFSENQELKKGYEINFATASFGQGIEITPIQLIRAFSAIANGGRMIRPYAVGKILEDGKVVKETLPETSARIISSKTASQLTAMMVSVVENGFGKGAKIPRYYVAGKTGTAQISWSSLGIDKKGYSDKTWQSFIGFAPAFNPRFLILVKLDNPETKTAAYSATPLFRELAEYIINYLEIPPDYEKE